MALKVHNQTKGCQFERICRPAPRRCVTVQTLQLGRQQKRLTERHDGIAIAGIKSHLGDARTEWQQVLK